MGDFLHLVIRRTDRPTSDIVRQLLRESPVRALQAHEPTLSLCHLG